MSKAAGQTPGTSADAAVTGSRVERKREQRVGRILDATADVLGRQGVSHFALEDVAEALDVTKGSLYHYFPSKDELVISGIETLARRILSDLRAEVSSGKASASERLRGLLDRQISVVVWDYPASVELFTLREPADAAHRIKALRAEHDALLRSLIEDGLKSKEFQLFSISASLECIYSSINMAPLWIDRSSRSAARRQIDELIDTLLMVVGVMPGRL